MKGSLKIDDARSYLDHLASDDVAAGRLVRLLPDELDYSTMLYAVYPSRRHLSAKVRTFIDFLAAWFAAG